MRGEGSRPPAPRTAVPGEGGQARCRPASLTSHRAVSHVVLGAHSFPTPRHVMKLTTEMRSHELRLHPASAGGGGCSPGRGPWLSTAAQGGRTGPEVLTAPATAPWTFREVR